MTFRPVSRMVVIGMLCVAGTGVASIGPRNLSNLEGHRSALKATLTMDDGAVRAVTLEGVGCPQEMCSKVKAQEQANSVWLDGLASVRVISATAGPVAAIFKFKDGMERPASILAVNRVLYVQRRFGLTEKIDLGSVSRIDFE